MSSDSANRVTIGRSVLVAIVAALVLCLMALAFLLGRESREGADVPSGAPAPAAARPSPPPPDTSPGGAQPLPAGNAAAAASSSPAAEPSPPASALITSPAAEPSPPAPALITSPAAEPSPPAPALITSPAAEPPPAALPAAAAANPAASPLPASRPQGAGAPPDAREREAVAAYFTAMENIQQGKLTDDPGTFAQELISSAMSGNTSGFDDLLRKMEAGRARAQAIPPPAPCREFHGSSLSLIDESLAMLKTVRDAIARQDLSKLSSLSTRAQSMKARAEALDRSGREIKRRYGVTR